MVCVVCCRKRRCPDNRTVCWFVCLRGLIQSKRAQKFGFCGCYKTPVRFLFARGGFPLTEGRLSKEENGSDDPQKQNIEHERHDATYADVCKAEFFQEMVLGMVMKSITEAKICSAIKRITADALGSCVFSIERSATPLFSRNDGFIDTFQQTWNNKCLCKDITEADEGIEKQVGNEPHPFRSECKGKVVNTLRFLLWACKYHGKQCCRHLVGSCVMEIILLL